MLHRTGMPSWPILVAAAFTLHAPAAHAKPEDAVQTIAFHRDVVNLENGFGQLATSPPTGAAGRPPFEGDVGYGTIARQVPGDPRGSRAHDVPFAVVFEGAFVVRARGDANLNGDLSDDPDLKLSLYPGDTPARSFLVPLHGIARHGGAEISIERLVRVVVVAAGAERSYRTQDVYGMLGSLKLEGASRLALLYDANRDGLYTKGSGDGMFVDLDGDRHFAIDVMAPDFAPLSVPFVLWREELVVDEIDPSGSRVVLRRLGAGYAPAAAAVGRTVPDAAFIDTDGRAVLLSARRGMPLVVYFWASWSAACRELAPGLRALYERYGPDEVAFFGVSYDTDRAAMERFRRESGSSWPNAFSGGIPSEDPLGRLFGEDGTGVFYVIDPEGRLAAKTADLGELNVRLAAMTAGLRATRRRPRLGAPSRPTPPTGTASRGKRGRRPAAARTAARTRGRGR